MAMTLVKKTGEYKIFKRGDDRYAVQGANGKAINGEEKVSILLAEELIKVSLPTPVAEAEPAEEAPAADEAAEEGTTDSAE